MSADPKRSTIPLGAAESQNATVSQKATVSQDATVSQNATVSMASPIGTLWITCTPTGVQRIQFEEEYAKQAAADSEDAAGSDGAAERTQALCERVVVQLSEYFDGSRTEFDLPLDLEGTPFQESVWTALSTIPYGETVTYATQADRIGRPSAVRAVGAANGRNPVPIVLPCHRVIGASGSLTGYAGGLDRKRRLLELEGALESPSLF